MKKKKKEFLINVLGGVIIGALILYIVGLVWWYIILWIPMQNSQEISREVDSYIREHGYEGAIKKMNPGVEIRSKEELDL